MSAKDKLQQAWNDNPIAVIIAVGGLLAGAARFVDAVAGIQSKRAYARRSRRRK